MLNTIVNQRANKLTKVKKYHFFYFDTMVFIKSSIVSCVRHPCPSIQSFTTQDTKGMCLPKAPKDIPHRLSSVHAQSSPWNKNKPIN